MISFLRFQDIFKIILKIDHDANGVGWFIDPTPQDNSEFIAHLSSNGENPDTYLLAVAESEAQGKYYCRDVSPKRPY